MIQLADGRVLAFAPGDDGHKLLLATATVATERILVCCYAYTLADLTSVLIDKHAAGVDVRLILDASQSVPGKQMGVGFAEQEMELALGGATQFSQIQRLRTAGIEVVTGKSAKGGIIHSKYLIADTAVCWGSFNMTLAAQRQCNQMSLESDPAVVVAFVADWQANWQRLTTEVKGLA